MADEIALNLMAEDFTAFMFTRSTGFHSGNWVSLKKAFQKAIVDNQSFKDPNYYKGRPFLPVAYEPLIKWSEE